MTEREFLERVERALRIAAESEQHYKPNGSLTALCIVNQCPRCRLTVLADEAADRQTRVAA